MLSNILTALVAIEHLYILYMEMFAWETRGKSFFKSLPEHLFGPTKGMAANQGLYNGFLVQDLCGATLSTMAHGAAMCDCFSYPACLLQVSMALLRHRVRFSFSKLCRLFWQVLPQCCLYKQTLGLEKLLSKPSVCFYIIYQM